MQAIANPESWNVVQLSAVDGLLRRVNITLNNVGGERVSVNDLTVTGCYDPAGRPVFCSVSFRSVGLRLREYFGFHLITASGVYRSCLSSFSTVVVHSQKDLSDIQRSLLDKNQVLQTHFMFRSWFCIPDLV